MNRRNAVHSRPLLLLLLTQFVFVSALAAQSGPTGALTGVVQDRSEAVMPGVVVTARNVGTGLTRTGTTDGEGRWHIAGLPVGNYHVSYEIAGFKKLTKEGVTVEAAVPRTIDAVLEVEAAPGEEVTVTENVLLVNPDTASTYRQISSTELLQVPTSTRSFTHLLSAEAGISADLPPVLGNGNGNISPSVNGTRTTSTSLQFNGVDATNLTSNEGSLTDNIAPAPETLQEVKLQTSLYDASTGRSGGGNFQLITKSGTNELHGAAYWYVQNEKFNANDFFYNKDGIEKPRARRNEGGFALGGPVIKDKTFFFGGYQQTQASTAFVPTAQSVTLLPEALRLISGQRTAANIVSAFSTLNPNFPLTEAQISPVALNILNIRNPVTGDFFIPAPGGSATRVGSDPTAAGFTGGNPFSRQRNVSPAEFKQDQFTAKIDQQFGVNNRLSGTFFFANFPGFDPFPDPSSLASPVTLLRNDRNRTLAINDIHTFTPTLINEARFGLFFLNNTRRQDDPFLAITNDSVGVPNPANFYDQSNATTRLGHYVGRNFLQNLSWGGPNDSFNLRDQKTYSFADNVSWIRGAHNFRIGGEYKRHFFDTNLPEEQATEFEKFDNFTQFLAGFGTEADTQFGITDKRFRMNDLSWYIADDWKVNRKLTLNLGVRWDWFGWPTERDGRIGNVDFSRITNTEDPAAGFIVPNNVQNTGFAAIDQSIATSIQADNGHTLTGQDLNNLAPRFGFAFSPFENNRLVFRGGYGIFFDRPSAAFINTVFSNYPFLRESEITAPSGRVPLATAWSQQDPAFPFRGYLPNRIQYNANGTYTIRDGTPVTRGADGSLNAIDLATGLPAVGNVAETFEFRAIDQNLRTPYVQQWNLGIQYEVATNLLFEARYLGTKGTKLLQATAFNQSYDLNDPGTPDYVLDRFVRAYEAAYQKQLELTGNPNVLRGPLRTGATARERGTGVAFGFPNSVTGNAVDYNLSSAAGNVIGFEARGPIMGFNIPEAVLLQSSSNSIYNSLQLNLTKRMSRGTQFNTSYTWSRSIDNNSADPGSTAGGGKPDVPNVGFVVQGDQRNLYTNRAVSDFDRTHRFSLSFVYELPTGGSTSRWLRGWSFSGFTQIQTGSPFSIISAEPEVATVAQYTNLARGSGGLFRHGFGRPSINGTHEQLRQKGSDPTEQFFNPSVLVSPLGGLGGLGRNVLRNDYQKRFDVSLAKNTSIKENIGVEFRWDVFNLFNNVNFATPGNDLQDSTDFGRILNTIGGPRVMQFGLRFVF
jgi:Carboxypeptidase regulatory-like domain